MARRAAWILVLLVVLLVISVSAALGASMTHSIVASPISQTKMSTWGATAATTLTGTSDGRHTVIQSDSFEPFGCHHNADASSPAY